MVTGTPEPKSALPVIVVASARALSARALLAGTARALPPPVSSPVPPGDAVEVPKSPPPSPLDAAARFAESRLALRRHRLAGRWDLSMSFESASCGAFDDGELEEGRVVPQLWVRVGCGWGVPHAALAEGLQLL